MGQRASDTRGITFEDVVVPAEVSTKYESITNWVLSYWSNYLVFFGNDLNYQGGLFQIKVNLP